jgi:hypothetical protein
MRTAGLASYIRANMVFKPIHTHTHIYIYAGTDKAYSHTHVLTYKRIYRCIHAHTHIHTCTHMRTCIRRHTHTHTHTHTHMHKYTHTHTHTHTDTHRHTYTDTHINISCTYTAGIVVCIYTCMCYENMYVSLLNTAAGRTCMYAGRIHTHTHEHKH